MNRDEHRGLREALGAYALGHLDPAERTAVEAHLDGCPGCRAELAEIAPVVGPLGGIDPTHLEDVPPAPPPWLGDRIVQRVRAEQPVPARRSRVRAVAAAAAVAAVLAGGGGYVWGSVAAAPDVPREPVAVQAAAAGLNASATVVPHTWGVEITLVADGFRPGAVYRVVVVDDDGRRVGAGEFIGTGEAEMRCNLNSSVLRADASGFDVLDDQGHVVLHGQL